MIKLDRKEETKMIKKPQRINKSLLHAGRMPSIKGVVLHNDAGSRNATAIWYMNSFLPNHNLELGIAHYYIDADVIGRAIDTYNQAWHTASAEGNNHYIGYEACQSKGDEARFIANEDMMLRQAAEDMLFYKIPVNRQTVRLHQEFSSTTCPHRSMELHGRSVNAVKDYFIARIMHYQRLGKTVDEMIDAENRGAIKAQPKPALKPIDEVAREVLAGRWGNGQERKNKLTQVGYNYDEVQKRVGELKVVPKKEAPSVKPDDLEFTVGGETYVVTKK